MSKVINYYPFKLELPTGYGRTIIYKYSDIMYIIYDKPYSVFHIMDGTEKKRYAVPVSLANIERYLPQILFRCNLTTIINFCYIKETAIHRSGLLTMTDNMDITISQRKMPDFKIRKAGLTRLTPLCEGCNTCSIECHVRDAFCVKEKPA